MDKNFIFLNWLDTRKIPLPEKIAAALRRYEEKFGKPPSIIQLPLNEEYEGESVIAVEKYRHILPNNILIGAEKNE